MNNAEIMSTYKIAKDCLETVKDINVRDMSRLMIQFLKGQARIYIAACDILFGMRTHDEHHPAYVTRLYFKKSLADPRSTKLIYKILDRAYTHPQQNKIMDAFYSAILN